jgi:hypothetical protein
MDTDDLTNMAYYSIVIAASFNDFLKAELGAEARHHKTEDEYLNAILKKVKRIKRDIRGYLDGWNLIDEVNITSFRKDITLLIQHIENTINTSKSDRRKFKLKG